MREHGGMTRTIGNQLSASGRPRLLRDISDYCKYRGSCSIRLVVPVAAVRAARRISAARGGNEMKVIAEEIDAVPSFPLLARKEDEGTFV